MPGRWWLIVPVVTGATLGAISSAIWDTRPALAAGTAPALDYGFFKNKVEPIFLEKRPGHTRCYFCHAESNTGLRLEKLSPGHEAWTEEQSRKNFDVVSKLVNPGEPDTSRLLLHPLAPEGGGDAFHSGGRQFADKNDPDWKAIAAWVGGAKADGK